MNKTAKADVGQIRQTTQYSCCAASIASGLKALGKDVSEADVNKVLGAEPMRGASWEEILTTLQYFGVRGTLVVPATPRMLKEWTDRGIPVLIGWNPEGRPWSHASVVFDVTEDKDGLKIHVMDSNIPNPSKTTRVVHEDEFCSKWSEKMSDSLIMRRPACAMELEVSPQGKQVKASMNYSVSMKLLRNGELAINSSPFSQRSVVKILEDHEVPYTTQAGTYFVPVGVRWMDELGEAFERAGLVWTTLRNPTAEPSRFNTDVSLVLRPNGDLWVEPRKEVFDDVGIALNESGAPYTVKGDYFLVPDGRRWGVRISDALMKKRLDVYNKTAGKKVKKEVVQRDPNAKALKERAGVGGGSHKNKQDYERGHARQPKHKKPFDKEASMKTAGYTSVLKLKGIEKAVENIYMRLVRGWRDDVLPESERRAILYKLSTVQNQCLDLIEELDSEVNRMAATDFQVVLIDAETKKVEWKGKLSQFKKDNSDDEGTLEDVKDFEKKVAKDPKKEVEVKLGGGASPDWILKYEGK